MVVAQTPLTVRRWTREEYDRLAGHGIFDGEPLELIAGQLIVAEPKGTYHVASVGMVGSALRAALPPGWMVRDQAPVAYWIVNLVDRVLEVYRDPGPDVRAPFGWHYRSVERLAPTATVTLHALPAVRVAVAHLLP